MGSSWFLTLKQADASVLDFIRQRMPGAVFSFIDAMLLSVVDLVRLCPGRYTPKGIEKCTRPVQPLIFYEYEGCPFCRKVREVLSTLDIEHIIYPCPRETLRSPGRCINSRFRPELLKVGGQLQFPFMIDPNTNKKMYESNDIMDYLWATYGNKATKSWNHTFAYTEPFLNISMKISQFLRPCVDMGVLMAPSRRPKEMLELWGYESSGFVRRVRETLAMLEIPYIYHTLPMGSPKREAFAAAHANYLSKPRKTLGLVQVPFLKDPNTKTEMFESANIVKYLKDTYQTAEVLSESWRDYGIDDKKKQ